MNVVCVALIGKKNNPLYIRSTTEDPDDLTYTYMVHSALDIVEEKVASAVKSGANDDLKFLGLLQPSGESYLYGYVTSSGIKLMVVIKGTLPKEQDVRGLFHKLHAGYTNLVRNPFYKPGSDIKSSSFDKLVRQSMPAARTA